MRVPTALPPAVLGVVAAAIAAAGSGAPSFSGDESASVMSATRSWSSLATMLGRVDAVHGLYYSFLHVWVQVAGTSEAAVRFPSAVAAGLAVAGTVVLGRMLFGTRAAIAAGAILAITPSFTYLGLEARSYPFAVAAAAWTTALAVRLLRASGGRHSALGWSGYAAAIAASIYLFEYLALLIPVHLALAVAERSRATGRLVIAGVVAVAAALPLVLLAYTQRTQIGLVSHDPDDLLDAVFVDQWFRSPVFAAAAWALVLVGLGSQLLRRSADGDPPGVRRRATAIASWAFGPTALILAADATLFHLYNERYLAFCLPAIALLAGLGADRIIRMRHPLLRVGAPALAAVLLVASALPVYLSQRGPYGSKDSDLRQASAVLARHASPGDAVIFDQHVKNSWKPSMALRVYPRYYTGLVDLTLRTDYRDTAGLWDVRIPVHDLGARLDGHPVIWAMEIPSGDGAARSDLSELAARGYRVTAEYPVHRTIVYRLELAGG